MQRNICFISLVSLLIVLCVSTENFSKTPVTPHPKPTPTILPTTPTIPLPQQQQIYQEFAGLRAKGSDAAQLQKNIDALCQKHRITRDQLLEIQETGRAAKWPTKGTILTIPASGQISQAMFPQAWPFTVTSGQLQCERELLGDNVYILLKTDQGIYALNSVYKIKRWETAYVVLKGNPSIEERAKLFAPFIKQGLALCPPIPTPVVSSDSSAISSSPAVSSALPPLDMSKPVDVQGYYRKDGTYVRPHTRNLPHTRK